jgi:dihydroorotase
VPADLVVLDSDFRYTIDRKKLHSKSKNTPFHGRAVHGRAELTVLGGRVVHEVEGHA